MTVFILMRGISLLIFIHIINFNTKIPTKLWYQNIYPVEITDASSGSRLETSKISNDINS